MILWGCLEGRVYSDFTSDEFSEEVERKRVRAEKRETFGRRRFQVGAVKFLMFEK